MTMSRFIRQTTLGLSSWLSCLLSAKSTQSSRIGAVRWNLNCIDAREQERPGNDVSQQTTSPFSLTYPVSFADGLLAQLTHNAVTGRWHIRVQKNCEQAYGLCG